jgi:glycosyltransferase involved in cell wall biosynthesis
MVETKIERSIAGHVLMDATPVQSEHRYRGVGTYVRHLSRELAHEWPDHMRFAMTVRPQVEVDPAVKRSAIVGFRPHRPAQVYWLYNELFLQKMVHVSRPTLFHATDFNGLVVVPGVPTVVTLYDVTGLSQPGTAFPSLSDRLSRWRWAVYRQRLAHATRVIAITHHVKRTAIELLGLSPSRIAVIPLGVDPAVFHGTTERCTGAEAQYFLYVGSLEPHKNVSSALAAFARLRPLHPQMQFWLAGPWNEEDRRRLEQLCHALHIAPWTRWLGHVDLSQLVALYQHAVALVFPSVAEGFGAPIIEAMACGTPVICANFGAMAEVAGNAALTVDVRDVDALAQAMVDLSSHPRLGAELTRAGLSRAHAYSWKSVAQQTWDVYREALADFSR